MKSNKHSQSGFTLVDNRPSVVVIIGLLLGGVLKGQEMIRNGKIKNAINDMNGVRRLQFYGRRFHRLARRDGPVVSAEAPRWRLEEHHRRRKQ